MDVLNAISATSEYACWCSSGENWSEAKGTPLDAMDELCKGYVQAMKCVNMDVMDDGGEEAAATCDPMKTRYLTTGIDFFNLHQLTIDDIVAKCNAANEGLCQKSVCMVDVSMIPNVWHIIKAGHDFIIENGFKHASGFDRETTCHFDATAVAGAGASAAVSGDESAVASSNNRAQAQFNGRETECCGSQPFRKPYKTQEGKRQCCAAANLPYDATKFTCCESGEVKVACD